MLCCHRNTSSPSLLLVQYEPRGPGRPLYQRRISSSYPDESSPAAGHGSALPHPPEHQDHPHAHTQHLQQPHGPYGYPPQHDLWPSNGGGPGPFQNLPCNGAGAALAQQRDLLGECGMNEREREKERQRISSFNEFEFDC